MTPLVSLITAPGRETRNLALETLAAPAPAEALLEQCDALEQFRHSSDNLYHRVRALFFLSAIHRYHLPRKPGVAPAGRVPYDGYLNLLERRFEEAIRAFLAAQRQHAPSDSLSSALALAYKGLAFQTLANQVRRSVRSLRGNQWMFRTGHPVDHPLRLRPELLRQDPQTGLFPILRETVPVRMDLSHSGWSDIFFLGMDYPEGARVLNTSINLALWDRLQLVNQATPPTPHPPVEAYLRVIDEPVLRLVSTDLQASADLTHISDTFDFARDYLGLLKAAVIAAGLVPPGLEGAPHSLPSVLETLTGLPGHGLEIVSQVNGIPKGSRLAVSTNLLAALISVSMRATAQIPSLTGPLEEPSRRLVAARAILGEWLGGSGGGWQDSGGVWPGMKLIQGVVAAEGDVEFGVSRGCLLPRHRVFTREEISPAARQSLQDSLVLVHGGMAQDVGPILEMVTEKYLLRSAAEWQGRQQAIALLDEIIACLQKGDIRGVGACTQRNFDGPVQTIIPWAANHYTQLLTERVRAEFGDDFWGFWMLGGMAGGGMGFLFAPEAKPRAQERLAVIMSETKRSLQHAVPFAMDPVVYDFTINEDGATASFQDSLPTAYYTLRLPDLLRRAPRTLTPAQRAGLVHFGQTHPDSIETVFRRLLPSDPGHYTPSYASQPGGAAPCAAAASQATSELSSPAPRPTAPLPSARPLETLLDEYGFDRHQHEKIRLDLRAGRIGLAQNRLPANTTITDVAAGDVADARLPLPARLYRLGEEALRSGQVAVITLAGGIGSRWTRGAGVVKALNPFAKFAGRHRNFIEIHLAKSRRAAQLWGPAVPHVFTTSYLTHPAIEEALAAAGNYGYDGPLYLSPGRSVGLRLVPTARDLRFAWEETARQVLDEQRQKVQDSLHAALIQWAQSAGEASDYTDNLPEQCLHPVGHWYEVPNLLRNGVLSRLLQENPNVRYLLLHNIDTLGAALDPALLGLHIESGATMSAEVIAREVEDRGGGLARIDGHLRLVEGLALPDERLEFDLTYYNTNTFWLDLQNLLAVFGLPVSEPRAPASGLLEYAPADISAAIRQMANRMPTYVTLKDVKKRWGHGQEDIYPVTQFEKLWGDMTALPEMTARYFAVPRPRGQQLKDVAQLDPWLRDGSAAHVASLCDWS